MFPILRHLTGPVLVCVFTLMALTGCAQTGLSRLDPGWAFFRMPVWSPDSQSIAYTRYENRGSGYDSASGEIYVMDIATRQQIQLTHNDVQDFNPTWSHDGQRLAYTREVNSYDAHIQSLVITNSLRILNLDGSGDKELFVCPYVCDTPSWSPSGNAIAFRMAPAKPETNSEADALPVEIYLINIDGTGLTRLTDGLSHAWGPRWSPDSRQITFWRYDKNPIRIIDLQTRVEKTIIIDNLEEARDPTWLPDNAGIVFSADRPDRSGRQLNLYRLDSGTVKPLFIDMDDADLLLNMEEPDWSPDGTKLVFSAYQSQLYVVDISVDELP